MVKDYKELFAKCLAKQEMKPKSGLVFSRPTAISSKNQPSCEEHISVDGSGTNEEEDSLCLCFWKSKSKQTNRTMKIKKQTNSRWIDVPYPSFLKEYQEPTNMSTESEKARDMFTQSDTGEKILAKGDPGMGKTT